MKKLLFAVIFTVICASVVSAQDKIDSLYREAQRIFFPLSVPGKVLDSESLHEKNKCSLGLISEINSNRIALKERYGSQVLSVLERPVMQKSLVTPEGLVRVHFDTTGVNAVQYDIQQFLRFVDISYKKEVEEFGFPDPVKDLGNGGDELLDVYILDLGNTYGFTVPDGTINPAKKTVYTFIKIHNDFTNFFTKGLEAARVTIAHELHHTIQMSNYTYKLNGGIEDLFFYEMTSTSMEEFVFDEVNDYYNYLGSFFRNPSLSIGYHSGYDLAHWNIYLRDKYNMGLIRRQWELFRTNKAVEAIDNSLIEQGSSYMKLWAEFGIWCFYTGYLKQNGRFFEEGANYPMLAVTSSYLVSPPFRSDSIRTTPASISVLEYINNSDRRDTLKLLLCNGDAVNASYNPDRSTTVFVKVANSEMPNSVNVSDRFFVFYNCPDGSAVEKQIVFNNAAIGWIYSSPALFPNPFKLKNIGHTAITIPVPDANGEIEAEFSVFDAGMQLVYHGSKPILLNNIRWDPRTEFTVRPGSGVYFYILKTKNTTTTGKLTIINGQ